MGDQKQRVHPFRMAEEWAKDEERPQPAKVEILKTRPLDAALERPKKRVDENGI